MSSPSTVPLSTHLQYLSQCLELASQSPPKPTNFRVGAILLLRLYPTRVNPELKETILSTGYTLELRGNTHAEQCCFAKLASHYGVPEEEVGKVLEQKRKEEGGEAQMELYVTMEPCGKRLSDNKPCVDRIIETRKDGKCGIDRIYFGVKEPGTFVGQSQGCKKLDEAGVQWNLIEGMEDEILKVATAGHEKKEKSSSWVDKADQTVLVDRAEEEARRGEPIPRNPKKRMMEG
ncbi:hypothetical protein MGYG_02281 [Nannizzia gypsea CBS 118893]|uniref:CMP/dCMP-type deaminase domain-containing protein n=1 Tax=Arthroderma gypseum (strain ATCC MYA-4604 / CBS 118893) TaxID=535722 RepID=E4UQU2_ARTGP|nr:hypothetical protein MGYG_02281 [Nannizzia gypsea CBS 118893]EFQ99268.1 hypothetical protein MGYG_02281 [Nannizzia gypsea CBS 118893]